MLARPMITQPTPPVSPATMLDIGIFMEQVEECIKRTGHLDENIKKLWGLVWG